jgi:hypothetical protein
MAVQGTRQYFGKHYMIFMQSFLYVTGCYIDLPFRLHSRWLIVENTMLRFVFLLTHGP